MLTYVRKIAVLAMLVCVCAAILPSCKGGIDRDEAKEVINEFFSCIVAEDFEGAQGYLHPERPAELKPFLESVEADTGVDFQEGIIIERYSNFSSAYYDSSVGGSTYELTMITSVGESKVKFTIELVQNDNGYGIYNLDIDT